VPISSNNASDWSVEFTGDLDNPEHEMLVVTRQIHPQIRLEVHASGIESVGAIQDDVARKMIQDAVNALQEALDSPSALLGVRPT
jgi:hypothetical protein